MQTYINTYKNMRKRLNAYGYAMWLLEWDLETDHPMGAVDYRAEQIEVLSNEIYELETDRKYVKAIAFLNDNLDKLDDLLKREIKKIVKEMRLIKKMPKQEYIDYQVLLSKSTSIWSKARQNDDFESFLPTLEKIVAFQRKIVRYLQT